MAKTFTACSISYHGQKTAPEPCDWVGRLQPVSDRFPNPGTRGTFVVLCSIQGWFSNSHDLLFSALCHRNSGRAVIRSHAAPF